ncbi:MAG: transposase [Synergistaceae bacterium]|nr:transposase [Synergistaceae bacterium]
MRIIFLPPYSHELNPIEHFENWLKRRISSYTSSCENLNKANSVAFEANMSEKIT